MERGDEVVVLLAALVVEENALLERFVDDFVGDCAGGGGRRGKPRLYGRTRAWRSERASAAATSSAL